MKSTTSDRSWPWCLLQCDQIGRLFKAFGNIILGQVAHTFGKFRNGVKKSILLVKVLLGNFLHTFGKFS